MSISSWKSGKTEQKKTWYSPCKTRVSAYRPKEQQRIFDRFTGSNGRSGQSNGIGLALAGVLLPSKVHSHWRAANRAKNKAVALPLPSDGSLVRPPSGPPRAAGAPPLHLSRTAKDSAPPGTPPLSASLPRPVRQPPPRGQPVDTEISVPDVTAPETSSPIVQELSSEAGEAGDDLPPSFSWTTTCNCWK